MTPTKAVLAGLAVLAVIIGVAVYAKQHPQALGEPNGTESPGQLASPTASPSGSITPNTMNDRHEITISTNFGDIVLRTYDGDAPKTVENFTTLASKGFYDGLTFHRIIEGFMIQGGDPAGTGMGGPGYTFADELAEGTESAKRGYVRGTVAMANAGPNTNGSQFFIMHADYRLPHNYTIFGHVVSGMEVVDKIVKVETDANDKPVQPVKMLKVTVADLP